MNEQDTQAPPQIPYTLPEHLCSDCNGTGKDPKGGITGINCQYCMGSGRLSYLREKQVDEDMERKGRPRK